MMIPDDVTEFLADGSKELFAEVEKRCTSRGIYFGATILLETLIATGERRIANALSLLSGAQRREIDAIIANPYATTAKPGSPTVTGKRIWDEIRKQGELHGVVEPRHVGIALLEAIHSDDPTALVGLPLIALTRMLLAASYPLLGAQ